MSVCVFMYLCVYNKIFNFINAVYVHMRFINYTDFGSIICSYYSVHYYFFVEFTMVIRQLDELINKFSLNDIIRIKIIYF